MVSPRTAHPISVKYAAIPLVVSRMEPSEVGNIFRHAANNPYSFFPSYGLFSVEFALGYCNNMHYKRDAASEPVAARAQKK